MKLRETTKEQRDALAKAAALLRNARALLVKAGAPRAADKVRSAIKSTDGAIRHAARTVR